MSETQPKEDYGAPKDKISFINSIRRQIERCLLTALDQQAFATNVSLLIQMLPTEIKESKEFQKRYNSCFYRIADWRYSYCGKWPMGTPENPVTDADGRVLSPVFVEEEVPDYNMMFELALEMLDRLGILYERKPKVREVWK